MDDGVSGVIPFHERPGGAHVLELLRTGKYAGIACLNHKRIGRDAYVIHLAVRQIEQELGGDIQAIREPVPSQLAPGARALMRAMYAGVAQYDREELLAALRAGKLRAAKEGRFGGGLDHPRTLHALCKWPIATEDRPQLQRARRPASDRRPLATDHTLLHARESRVQRRRSLATARRGKE
jgi:DNA invertase Pin-like site-specific DNA recombinase